MDAAQSDVDKLQMEDSLLSTLLFKGSSRQRKTSREERVQPKEEENVAFQVDLHKSFSLW